MAANSRAQVERLNSLLAKSVAYSDFLANKIKKEGEDGTVAVADGSVKGTGLKQPVLVQGEMRPYQLIGVHWLVGLYENGLNGILGDEMGLGKTVQSIAMLAHLHGMGVHGPFMVVGPLSTLHNWANEFKKWTPKMDAVVYHGSKEERKDLRLSHWQRGGKGANKDSKNKDSKQGDMPVMITSYEIVIRDIAELRKISWKFIIIDEGHRLKNMNCRLSARPPALPASRLSWRRPLTPPSPSALSPRAPYRDLSSPRASLAARSPRAQDARLQRHDVQPSAAHGHAAAEQPDRALVAAQLPAALDLRRSRRLPIVVRL